MFSVRHLQPVLAASSRSLAASTRWQSPRRRYGSTPIPAERSVLVRAPPPDTLEDVGAEDLPPLDQAVVVISNRAAEVCYEHLFL
jgi:hypothetical protein